VLRQNRYIKGREGGREIEEMSREREIETVGAGDF
jgi:hypothetical protein